MIQQRTIVTRLCGVLVLFALFSGVFIEFALGCDHTEENRDDLVDLLPGLPLGVEMKSKWYSGYINTSIPAKPHVTLSYHYILIESENDPENDPLVLWTNGGPGAPSLWGLFTELGPYYLSSQSMKNKSDVNEIPRLFENQYSWSKLANLLVLSGPPPVSFGFCDPGGPDGDGYSCGNWNDTSTAQANFAFLEGFFKKFPRFERNGNEFYLTGESYAGIYIPTLAREILSRSKKESVSRKLLKGLAIGDGCVGHDLSCASVTNRKIIVEIYFDALFLFGHGQVSTASYKKVLAACEDDFQSYKRHFEDELSPDDPNFAFDTSSMKNMFRKLRTSNLNLEVQGSEECIAAYFEMKANCGYIFEYNLYDECWDDQGLPMSEDLEHQPNQILVKDQPASNANYIFQQYPCGGGTALKNWVGRPAVRKALHVPLNARYVSADNAKGLDFSPTEANLLPFHKHLAETSADLDLRVLIYNGDTDTDLNSFFGEWWVNALKLDVKEKWRPWTLDGKQKVLGYVQRFHGNYDYLTVKGSGHMVPQMRPVTAFEMLRAWLKKEEFKPYTKPVNP